MIEGSVSLECLKPGASLISLYFPLSLSMGPKSRARIGQASTQTGFLWSASRSVHIEHICILELSSSPNCGTSYGQASLQNLLHLSLPRHLFGSTTIIPSSSLFAIASTGQASLQAGVLQWLHEREIYDSFSSGYLPCSRGMIIRNSIDVSFMSCQSLQAITHA